MVESGGVRADIGADQHLTPGENRTLQWPTTDTNGAPVTSFAGWEVDFFWVERFRDADAPEALAAVADLVRKEDDAAPKIDLSSPPDIFMPLLPTDWGAGDGEIPGERDRHAYEIWETDVGNVHRLAYGTIEVER